MTKKKLSWRPYWIFDGYFSINFPRNLAFHPIIFWLITSYPLHNKQRFLMVYQTHLSYEITAQNQYKKQNKNKAISMMRGKSPRSDSEMSTKKCLWRPSRIFGGHLRLTIGTWYACTLYMVTNNHLFKFCFFNHKVNNRYTNCHILPFLHNADQK